MPTGPVAVSSEAFGFVERIAALDIGKAELTGCIRVPHNDDEHLRWQEVRQYLTTGPGLRTLTAWLTEHRVSKVVMESTSDYWKPVFWHLGLVKFSV